MLLTELAPDLFAPQTLPRRVAMICVHTSPLATLGGKDAGGMNVHVRDLAIHIGRCGVLVDIFTRRASPDRPRVQTIEDGVRIINLDVGEPIPIDKNGLYALLPQFAEECALFALQEGLRYDVVHAHYWLSGVVAQMLRPYWETPFVLIFHTTAEMKNAVLGGGEREPELRQRTERELLDQADSIIAANPDERADLVWRQGVDEEKVCTIPPGVDLTLFRPHDWHKSRAALGWSLKERIVIYVGRIDPIKGIDTLIDALPLLQEPDVHIVLIGGDLDDNGQPIGPLADVKDRVTSLGMALRVRFLGAQPQGLLPLFYSAADVVAVPSRYESFGLVAVEAMATGTPVVASSVGGLSFTVNNGVSGYLVPYGEPRALARALDKLLEDDDLREGMGFQATIDAQRFSWDTVVQQVMHLYTRLAEGHRANLCCEDEIFV